jgi:hypothetical protein
MRKEKVGDIESIRAKTIVQLLGIGKYIAKEILGVELNYTKLPKLIKDTRKKVGTNIGDDVFNQILEGRYFPIYIPKETKDGDSIKVINEKKYIIQQHPWIKHPIHECNYKGKQGFALDKDNLIDLEYHLYNQKTWELSELHQILLKVFPNIDVNIHQQKYWDIRNKTWKTKPRRSLFIRLEDLISFKPNYDHFDEILPSEDSEVEMFTENSTLDSIIPKKEGKIELKHILYGDMLIKRIKEMLKFNTKVDAISFNDIIEPLLSTIKMGLLKKSLQDLVKHKYLVLNDAHDYMIV